MRPDSHEIDHEETNHDSDDPVVIIRSMIVPFVLVFAVTIGIVWYLGAGQERNLGWSNIGCKTWTGFCSK